MWLSIMWPFLPEGREIQFRSSLLPPLISRQFILVFKLRFMQQKCLKSERCYEWIWFAKFMDLCGGIRFGLHFYLLRAGKLIAFSFNPFSFEQNDAVKYFGSIATIAYAILHQIVEEVWNWVEERSPSAAWSIRRRHRQNYTAEWYMRTASESNELNAERRMPRSKYFENISIECLADGCFPRCSVIMIKPKAKMGVCVWFSLLCYPDQRKP